MGSNNRHKVRLLGAAALLAASCGFSPRVPDGTIVCNRDTDCPAGLICTRSTDGTAALCCRGGTCPARISAPGRPGPATSTDAGEGPSPSPAPVPDAGADAAAGAPAPRDAAGVPDTAPDSAGAAALVTCSDGAENGPPPAAGRKLYCAISVGNDWSSLGLEIITGTDPVSATTHGVCQAALKLGEQTTSPGGGARPLAPPNVDALVAVLERFQQVCAQARGTPVGAVAASWARIAPNLAEIQARVRAGAQLELEVPDAARELELRYRGAARNRRARIVFDEWRETPEILAWPRGAAVPMRLPVPISFKETGDMYLAGALYSSFEAARVALRTRLHEEMRPALERLAELVGDQDLVPTVAVGPTTNATVLLAVRGELRDPASGWFDPERYQSRVEAAPTAVSSYGRSYGVLSPAQVDGFFPSIDDRQFNQLRSEPIRSRYGEWMVLSSIVLDILGDEVLATEFGFTFTNSYLGFLLAKLFPTLTD
jgi:hypothetical protein